VTRGGRTTSPAAGGSRFPGGWVERLGGSRGIAFRLGLIALAVVAVDQHVMRQSSLLVLLGFLLAGAILALPLARYAAAWLVFSLLRGLADDAGMPNQGGFFAEVDRWIGLGVTPTERLQDLSYTPGQIGLVDSIATWTHASYYVVPHVVAIGIWWVSRRRGVPLFNAYLRATVTVMAIGVVLYVLLPTSPPWLETYEHPTLDVVRIVHAANADSTVREDQIYTIFTDPNPRAAMPSLHTAITVLAAWVLWMFDRRLGVLGAIYAVLMAFALVYLGEHFVVDILAGLLVVGVVIVLVSRRAN
jgi:membrane-associated phospholipid phosphatase